MQQSKERQVKNTILEICSDGNVHSAKEITQLLISRGIITHKGDQAVANVLYRLRHAKGNKLMSAGWGHYQLQQSIEPYQTIINRIEELKTLDWKTCSEEQLKVARRDLNKLLALKNELVTILGPSVSD